MRTTVTVQVAARFAYTCTVQRSAWQWSRITRVHLQSIDLPGPRGWGPAGTLRVLLILEPYVFSSHVLIWRSCRAANRVASGILFCAVGSGASRTAVSGLDWTAVRSELRSAVLLLLLSVVTPESPMLPRVSCPVSSPSYALTPLLPPIDPFILKGRWPTWTECCLLYCYWLSNLDSSLLRTIFVVVDECEYNPPIIDYTIRWYFFAVPRTVCW